MRLTSGLLAVVCGCTLGLVVASPAEAVPGCASPTSDYPAGSVYAQLGIGKARDLARREAPKGERPVAVAVIDSGVVGDDIPEIGGAVVAGGGEVRYYHGTAVAGIIAGQDDGDQPVGIAQAAKIVDVRVYDALDPEDGAIVTSDRIAAGLEWVADNAKALNIKIANVSLVAEHSDRLQAAVRAVRAADVVVVAASGNRPQEGQPFDEDFEDAGPGPGEDAAKVLFPTGYDDVVSVSTTAAGSAEPDAGVAVLENSNTTVAVPTHGAVSYGLDGRVCVIEEMGTSWAAAQVSGILALIWQMYPKDTDEQVVARLVNTANGMPDHPTPLTGAGVVQPLEALTRPLDPARDGRVERTSVVERDSAPAVAPLPEEDPLEETREAAVWWGLIGGGILVVALLLRQVLARRRT